MADNILLNSGTGGSTVKTDDDGVAHWQYVKAAFGADNTQTRVTSTVGLPTDPLDRAARDLGKVDIASHDQYTPTDVDTGVGVDNALPVAIRLPASGGAVNASGDGANGLDVDVTRVQGTVTTTAAGDVAHDAVNSGSPLQLGAEAIAFGANPTAVAAADRTKLYANRHGVPFVLPGHMHVQTFRSTFTAAQTDVALVSVAAGTKIVLLGLGVSLESDVTVQVEALIGFGTLATPTGAGVVFDHRGAVPGSAYLEGFSGGVIGKGADDEDLRITSTVPTGGNLSVWGSYFTIES